MVIDTLHEYIRHGLGQGPVCLPLSQGNTWFAFTGYMPLQPTWNKCPAVTGNMSLPLYLHFPHALTRIKYISSRQNTTVVDANIPLVI
jgi:hypothetical protein